MIEIDGCLGEGGGQMLRTAAAFSAVTGQPARIFNIRANRKEQGLKAQHMGALEAVARLCGGRVDGLAVGSREVTIHPAKIGSGKFEVDVGTAGSAALVLQAILPVALSADGEVEFEITGGTDVKWAPTMDYVEHVFLPIIGKMGCEIDVRTARRGFYPEGGGKVEAKIKPWKNRRGIDLMDCGSVESIEVYSLASKPLQAQEVSERQVKGFIKEVSVNHEVGRLRREYVDSSSPGSCLLAVSVHQFSRKGSCMVGERGLRSEEIGRQVASALLKEIGSDAGLDLHMADQIIPYIALAGGRIRTSEITQHARTNVDIVNRFGYDVRCDGDGTISARL